MASIDTDVLVIAANLGFGGTQRVVTNLSNLWTEQGLRVCVATVGERGEAFPLHPAVTRVRLRSVPRDAGPLRLAWSRLRALWLVRGLLARTQAKVIISFGDLPNILVLTAALGLSRDIVISERNDPGRHDLGLVWSALRRLLYRRAWRVTANSTGILDQLEAYVPAEKLRLVHNPLVTEQREDVEGFDRPTILTAARLTYQKGYDVLLRAFALSEASDRGWQIVALGDGELREELAELAQELGIAEQVRWMGRVPEPMAYMAEADVFALPSRYEGTPNALLEAMACGLPAIVTDGSSGPLQVVQDGETGLVVPVEDPVALAAAIDRLAGQAELRERLGSAARERLRAHAPASVLAEWRAVLDERI